MFTLKSSAIKREIIAQASPELMIALLAMRDEYHKLELAMVSNTKFNPDLQNVYDKLNCLPPEQKMLAYQFDSAVDNLN